MTDFALKKHGLSRYRHKITIDRNGAFLFAIDLRLTMRTFDNYDFSKKS